MRRKKIVEYRLALRRFNGELLYYKRYADQSLGTWTPHPAMACGWRNKAGLLHVFACLGEVRLLGHHGPPPDLYVVQFTDGQMDGICDELGGIGRTPRTFSQPRNAPHRAGERVLLLAAADPGNRRLVFYRRKKTLPYVVAWVPHPRQATSWRYANGFFSALTGPLPAPWAHTAGTSLLLATFEFGQAPRFERFGPWGGPFRTLAQEMVPFEVDWAVGAAERGRG